MQLAGQGVEGGQFEQLTRFGAVKIFTFAGFVGVADVFGLGVGVAGSQLPVVGQGALDLQVDAFAAHQAGCFVTGTGGA
ncbi:hypothetical protein D3C75_1181470 [compost metagenome]